MPLIDSDSAAYACVGQRCVFCREVITRQDINPPRRVFTSADKTSHEDCLMYVQRKYPGVMLCELEGKLIRIKAGNVYGKGQ